VNHPDFKGTELPIEFNLIDDTIANNTIRHQTGMIFSGRPLFAFGEGKLNTENVIPQKLLLSEQQKSDLEEIHVDLERTYLVRGGDLHRSAVRINGYCSGFYVFFVEGDTSDHVIFLKYVFGENYVVRLVHRFRGISVYGSPLLKHIKASNKVDINSSPDVVSEFVFHEDI
jgi:hypothetical protein